MLPSRGAPLAGIAPAALAPPVTVPEAIGPGEQCLFPCEWRMHTREAYVGLPSCKRATVRLVQKWTSGLFLFSEQTLSAVPSSCPSVFTVFTLIRRLKALG